MLQNSTLAITPDIASHKILEESVKSYLETSNYSICEATYHSVFNTEIKEKLQNRFSMTALYIRGRADRLAIHNKLPLEFEWEAKTHNNKKYSDLTIEALPLIHHISKSKLGVRCLYVFEVSYYKNGHTENVEGGFWSDDIPAIREIRLPPRPVYAELRTKFKELFELYFPNISINENNVGGTGDPFVIIDNSEIVKLPHWKQIIDNAQATPGAAQNRSVIT